MTVPLGLQVALTLGLVLATATGFFWILRRIGRPRGAPGAASLRVLSAAAVGPRERVVLVELGDSWIMIGVAPGQVRRLHTMRRPAPGVPHA